MRIDGKAWVDTDALQVLRLEQRAYPPENVAHFTAIEYQKLEVDREQFWMPSTVKQETIPGAGNNSSGFIDDYVAEYQNCRKSPLPNPDEIIRPIPRSAQDR